MRSTQVTNAFTIDFEDWYQGLEIPFTQWADYEDRVVRAGRRLLQLLDEFEVRATFFVLGYVAEHHPEVIHEIAAAGHEIGTHGYSHTLIYQQTPEVFRAELGRSVRLLEDITGKPVLGHRAPFFSITQESLWALKIMSELGIRYDSSIIPVVNYRYGIADRPRWPYEIPVGDHMLLEFPPSTWRLLGHNLPIGGAYFRIYPYRLTSQMIRSLNRQGQPVVFYFHPWEMDWQHPRIELPRRIALTHYFNLSSTETRLRRLLSEFKFATMEQVFHVN
jgi:polysaccharide deacetylase family protein (PEP-CTERM system associated)